MNPQSQYRPLPGRGVRRLALAGVALVAGAMSSACDPCFGVTACEAPRVEVVGRTISNNGSGSSVAGVLVTFTRTGGVVLDAGMLDA